MKYRYHYCAFQYPPDFTEFLEENGVAFKVHDAGPKRKPVIVFDIRSDAPNGDSLVARLEEMKLNPLVYKEYSEKDRKNANYLWLFPKQQKIDILNEEEAFEFGCWYESMFGHRCYKHETQKGLLKIAKEPDATSKTAFWTISTGFSELFASRRVYEAVQASDLQGIEFLEVLGRDGRKSENIFQITSRHVIGRDCIVPGHGEVIERCPVCGKEQYDVSSAEYQLHLDLSKLPGKSDLYVTERMFGAGIAHPVFVISQAFYQCLKKAGLTGGAAFIPVVEIGE